MNRIAKALTIAAVVLAGTGFLVAQTLKVNSSGGVSPHETMSKVIDGNRVMVVYGRPYSKDPRSGEIRKIWGTLIPYGTIWRTGSDEATLFITQKPLDVNGTTIPAGCYTLWTLPAADGSAKMMINKQIGQWGINPRDPKSVYDPANDLVEVPATKSDLDTQIDQFTIAIDKNPDAKVGGGLLEIKWEKTQYSFAFTLAK